MNEIIRHIEFLLVTHDCVVIPGLGAVLAHTVPARISKGSDVMMPPSRTFSFNVTLNHNDGLLVSSVARAKSISFEVARSLVLGEVENMRRALDREGQLSLGLAGRLITDGNTLSFEPSSSASLSYEYMWLPPVNLISIGDLAKQRAAVRPQTGIIDYVTHAVRVAATFAILIALGFILSTPIKVENAQYASLGIDNFKPSVVQSQKSPSIITRPGAATSIKLYLQSHDDACEIADTAAHSAYVNQRAALKLSEYKVAADSETGVRFDPSDRYYLIIASLANEEDANKFIAQSKKSQLGILVKDGRYRVYAATGASLQEAQSAAQLLADRYPSSWVCRK